MASVANYLPALARLRQLLPDPTQPELGLRISLYSALERALSPPALTCTVLQSRAKCVYSKIPYIKKFLPEMTKRGQSCTGEMPATRLRLTAVHLPARMRASHPLIGIERRCACRFVTRERRP